MNVDKKTEIGKHISTDIIVYDRHLVVLRQNNNSYTNTNFKKLMRINSFVQLKTPCRVFLYLKTSHTGTMRFGILIHKIVK